MKRRMLPEVPGYELVSEYIWLTDKIAELQKKRKLLLEPVGIARILGHDVDLTRSAVQPSYLSVAMLKFNGVSDDIIKRSRIKGEIKIQTRIVKKKKVRVPKNQESL